MATEHWRYEKLDEDGKLKHCPQDDLKAKETGKYIINLPQWFDENPAERIRLGWIKHYYKEPKELKEELEYNPATQFIVSTTRVIDEYTCEAVTSTPASIPYPPLTPKTHPVPARTVTKAPLCPRAVGGSAAEAPTHRPHLEPPAPSTQTSSHPSGPAGSPFVLLFPRVGPGPRPFPAGASSGLQ